MSAASRAKSVCAVVVWILVLTSCGTAHDSRDPIVLVSRSPRWVDVSCTPSGEAFGRCTISLGATDYRTADGTRATGPATSFNTLQTYARESSVMCGGQQFNSAGVLRPTPDSPINNSEIRFDDGSALSLLQEDFVGIEPNTTRPGCFEATGSWEGTEGALLGRSGSYDYVENSLQSVLTLADE
ncbi:MAG: hypothetical protein GY708_24600 [Actinomycetia bacterium]|nr:hypothetical protein [Actinomycetes bacterium]